MRARGREYTRYSKPWQDAYLLDDFAIQRAGSGFWPTVAEYKDYNYNIFHPRVMEFDVRLAYHYMRSTKPWKDQANQFLDVTKGDFNGYICDFEETGNVLNRTFVASAIEWCLYVQAQTQKKVLIYSNKSIYQDFIIPNDGVRASQFGFHYAYPTEGFLIKPNIDTLQPPLPRGRLSFELLQYRFGEHDPSGCELDVFNGTVAEMRTYFGVGVESIPQPLTLEERVTALEKRLDKAGL